MGGLSAAASVIAVLQISESVISACYKYYKTAKGAKNDILEVITIIKDLKSTFQDTVQFLLDAEFDNEDPRLPLLKSLDHSFKACEAAMQNVAKELGMEISAASDPDNVQVSFTKKASWPRTEKDVRKIVQSLEGFKSLFVLAINGDALQLIRAMQGNVKQVSEGIETMIISDKHQKILDWLKMPNDPSTNHNAARKKHEPTTGTGCFSQKNLLIGRKPQTHLFGYMDSPE
jgi:hypothetical protein